MGKCEKGRKRRKLSKNKIPLKEVEVESDEGTLGMELRLVNIRSRLGERVCKVQIRL